MPTTYVPATNVAQVDLRYTYQGQETENTVYYWYPDGINLTVMEQLGLSITNDWIAIVQPNITSELTLREVYLTDLTTITSPTVTSVTSLPASGANGQPPSPNNVTLAINFSTSGRGRSSHGRNYLLGIAEAQVANNIVADSFKNTWLGFYQSADENADALGWTHVVISRISGGNPRTSALVQVVTSTSFKDSVVDSQRRRLPKRGR